MLNQPESSRQPKKPTTKEDAALLSSSRTVGVVGRARRLVGRLDAEDLSMLQVREPSEYAKKGKGKWRIHVKPIKKKGGNPPADYSAVETLVDLEEELAKEWPDRRKVIPLYMRLKAMVNY